MKVLSTIVNILLVTSVAYSQTMWEEPANINISDLAAQEGTCIVRPVGHAVTSKLATADGAEMKLCTLQEAIVVDALKFAQGTRVQIVRTERTKGVVCDEMTEGQNYFIMGCPSRNRILERPYGSWIKTESWASYKSPSDQSVLAVQVIPTGQTALTRKEGASWTMVASVADCLIGATNESIRYVCRFFRLSNYPGATPTGLNDVKTEFQMATIFRGVASKSKNPYLAAKFERLLNDWHFVGSADAFFKQLVACSAIADAFPPEDEELRTLTYSELPGLGGIPSSFVHTYPDPNVWADAMSTCKNVRLRNFLLDQLGGLKPDRAHELKLVHLLESENTDSRFYAVGHFTISRDEPDHTAFRHEDYVHGELIVTYTGLEEAVLFWKNYWK